MMNAQASCDWKTVLHYPILLIIVFLISSDFGCGNKPKKSEFSAGNYECTLFIPDLFSKTAGLIHGFPACTKDMDTIFWPVVPPKVLFSQKINGDWTDPQVAQFSEGNIQAPFYDISKHRLLFQLSDPEGLGSLDIWYVENRNSGWSIKRNLGSPPNSKNLESQPSVARNCNLYFTGHYKDGCLQRGIYCSTYKNGRYMKPELLPETINTPSIDYMPFISPNEDFLLFASSRPSFNEDSLRIFVSLKTSDGSWSTPVNLNNIVGYNETSRFPCMTPDGRHIIFLSNNMYWKMPVEILNKAKIIGGK